MSRKNVWKRLRPFGAFVAGAGLVVALGTCTISPSQGTNTPLTGSFTVLAWNDLGMHCISPTFDQIVILPPYNNLWAQVVKRGNPPQIVTAGITVSYRIDGNTSTYGKGGYSSFWDVAAPKMTFPAPAPAHNIGLAGKGLSGTMDLTGDHFEALGIPISPILDNSNWTPYQVGVITVKDSTGAVLVETRATVPVSDEMNCARCHGAIDTFANILSAHDSHNPTVTLGTTPVICASCHSDNALGTAGTPGTSSLSAAMHGFHSTVTSPATPACYDCHPGATTQCSRSTRHTAADGNCITCHGTLTDMATGLTAGRKPWLEEPKCVTCHNTGVAEVDTGAVLYRNATAHNGMYCESCHGSPHAMLPTNQVPGYPNIDAYQVIQYQAPTPKTLGSCGPCHSSSRGEGAGGEFAETHGGLNPEHPNGCSACHTEIPTTTASWPHAYQWQNSN